MALGVICIPGSTSLSVQIGEQPKKVRKPASKLPVETVLKDKPIPKAGVKKPIKKKVEKK